MPDVDTSAPVRDPSQGNLTDPPGSPVLPMKQPESAAPALAPASPLAPGGGAAKDVAAEQQALQGPMSRLGTLEAQKPKVPNLGLEGPPPDAREFRKHSMEFASAMAVLGAISSKFTRQPGGAALSAFAGAMDGWQKGNLQAYEQASQQWEQESRRTIANNNIVLQKYKLALADNSKNIDEQMATVQLIATQYHDQLLYDAAAAKNFTMVGKLVDKGTDQTKRLENSVEWLSAKRASDEQQTALLGEKVASGQVNPDATDMNGQPVFSEAQKAQMRYASERYLSGAYNTGKAKAPVGGLKGQLLAEEEARRAANNEPPMTPAEKRNFLQTPARSGPALALQRFIQNFPATHGGREASDQDITNFSANYAGAVSRARSLGVRSSNVDVAAREAAIAANLALQRSDEVPRGEWVPINQLKQAAAREGSSPALGRFDLANAALITAYSQTMSRTGVNTVEAQKRASDLLSTSASKEVYRAKVEQLIMETNVVQQAVRDVEAESGLGGGGAATPPAATPAAGGGGGVIKYDAEGNRVQ